MIHTHLTKADNQKSKDFLNVLTFFPISPRSPLLNPLFNYLTGPLFRYYLTMHISMDNPLYVIHRNILSTEIASGSIYLSLYLRAAL